MILLADSGERERDALAELCGSRGWVTASCASVAEALRRIPRLRPRAVVVRHHLRDGTSDQLLAALGAVPCPVFVLAPAGTTADAEARQITLGAAGVLREPVRLAVLLAHLERSESGPAPASRTAQTPTLTFAGGRLDPADHTLRHGRRAVRLAPREAQLAEILARAPGEVVSYDSLYAEILGRAFRGDTGNLRVLLGKLAATAARAGLRVRAWVEVIPKTGYRHRRTPPSGTEPVTEK